MNDLLLSEEDLRKREIARRRNMESLADLAEVCGTLAGARFLARILRDLGVGRPLGGERVDCYNFGMRLLEDIGKAAPEAWNEILRQVFRGDD